MLMSFGVHIIFEKFLERPTKGPKLQISRSPSIFCAEKFKYIFYGHSFVNDRNLFTTAVVERKFTNQTYLNIIYLRFHLKIHCEASIVQSWFLL